MRQSESALPVLDAPKAAFVAELSRRLRAVAGVKSVTLTGSFVDQPGLSGISDIDTVVVVERLTPAVLHDCEAAATAVSCALLGLPGHELHLNNSFGPLKFDAPNRVVIHLMIYSVEGHRTHVLKSPFTCLDWERSPVRSGPSLREIYPVLTLQPRQFLESRRGLSDYLDDLAACAIRFRRYEISGDTVREVADRKPLDPRHQGEFAYHIVRNFVGNYAKLFARANRRLTTDELIAFWRKHLPASARFTDWFLAVEALKRGRAAEYPADTLEHTREFLLTANQELEELWRRRAVRHPFVRHARTALNDGRFLGQGRDPGIDESVAPLATPVAHVFASPARRTQETAAALQPGRTAVVDARLHEINYGRAEGLGFAELGAAFPELPAAWQRGEDPRFPDGENTADVLARLDSFLATLPTEPSLVVTHNVVLRCLLGSRLGIPMSRWHLIPVAHGAPFEVVALDGEVFLDLPATQIAAITDAVIGYRA